MEKTVRINKALADAGICSRRRADELIAAGRVSVNGEPVASPGLQVTPGTDKLEVDGKPVQPIAQAPCYLLLNKPVIVAASDATRRLKDGTLVSVDCARGIVQTIPQ